MYCGKDYLLKTTGNGLYSRPWVYKRHVLVCPVHVTNVAPHTITAIVSHCQPLSVDDG